MILVDGLRRGSTPVALRHRMVGARNEQPAFMTKCNSSLDLAHPGRGSFFVSRGPPRIGHRRAPVKKKGRPKPPPPSPPSFEYRPADEDADADEQEQHEDEEQSHDHDEASLLARGGDGRREFGGDEKAPSKHRGLSFQAACPSISAHGLSLRSPPSNQQSAREGHYILPILRCPLLADADISTRPLR
jgi:hypothetical protein